MDTTECYRALAKAIIAQAVRDYRHARTNHNLSAIREIKAFFYSEWFDLLCDGRVDGRRAFDRLAKMKVKKPKPKGE